MASPALRTALTTSIERIVASFTARLPEEEAAVVGKRVSQLVHHTTGKGKCARGQLVVSTHEALAPQASNEEKERMLRAAVAIETLQSFLLVADDVMDESETRRGDVCWHRMPGIGLSAVNDAILLHVAAGEELREAMRGHPASEPIASTFNAALNRTLVGQMLDSASARKPEKFGWQRYEEIVTNKTSYYSFVLPLQIGMLGAQVYTGISEVVRMALRIGYLFQAQDDRLDVYGNAAVTGKIGSDIREGKCTWFACRALQLLEKSKDAPTRDRFMSLYSTPSPTAESVREVLGIYDKLRLQEDFTRFEQRYSDKLKADIREGTSEGLRPVLEDIVDKSLSRVK